MICSFIDALSGCVFPSCMHALVRPTKVIMCKLYVLVSDGRGEKHGDFFFFFFLNTEKFIIMG